MVAIWRVQNGKVFLDRTAMSFPAEDMGFALRMLTENVNDPVTGVNRLVAHKENKNAGSVEEIQ